MNASAQQSVQPPPPDNSPIPFPPSMHPDDYVKDRMERLRAFARRFDEKLGAFIKSKVLMLVRMTYHVITTLATILVRTILPLFAWLSLGEALMRYGSVPSSVTGAVIVSFPILVFVVHARDEMPRNWRQGQGAIHSLFTSAAQTPINISLPKMSSWQPAAIVNRLKHAAKNAVEVLYRFFTGPKTGADYYYTLWIGGALLITAAMLFTTVGTPLSDTWFANANIVLVNAIFVKAPVFISGIAVEIWNGTVLKPNDELIQRFFTK